MGGKHLAQMGVIVFCALAITVALLDAARKDAAPAGALPAAPVPLAAPDPLASELLRCQLIGEAGARDTACLAAWAENRRRFLDPAHGASVAASEPGAPDTPTREKAR